MKLLTAIKKASKKAEQSHGYVRCFITRKIPPRFCWIEVDLYGVRIDAQLDIEDLTEKDWVLEEDVV